MIQKTRIIPNKAAESFGLTSLGGFDVLKLYLHRLPAKGAKVSDSQFWKKRVYRVRTPEGKNIHFSFQDI